MCDPTFVFFFRGHHFTLRIPPLRFLTRWHFIHRSFDRDVLQATRRRPSSQTQKDSFPKGSPTDFAIYFGSCNAGVPRIGAYKWCYAIDWGGVGGWVGGGRMTTFHGLGHTFDSTSWWGWGVFFLTMCTGWRVSHVLGIVCILGSREV